MQFRREITIGLSGIAALSASMLFTPMISVPPLRAQAPATAAPIDAPKRQFEVASVKVNKSGDNRVMLGLQPGGRFTASNVPLRNLITQAYRIQATQLVGGPDWIRSERFDISAKADGDPSQEQIAEMMQALLAERFALAVHRDTREMPVYALSLARADGRLGDKLKPSAVDCEALFGRGRGRGGLPPAPAPGAPVQCGMRMGPGLMNAGSTTLDQFANSLGLNVGRIVQNKTGLTGRYDIELSWTPEGRGGGPAGAPGGAPAPGGFPAPDASGVSIFTAIQEQLGLKLDSTRAPIEVLVIDSVTMPTPD
jgi:uncharacterized protein (TIGR03435 family)